MNQVVARLLDGRVVKGSSLDVDPGKPIFHVRDAEGRSEKLLLRNLKAIFFVRSLEGDPTRNDATQPKSTDPRVRGSFPITVTFQDGEKISGLTNRYPPNRPFFFILPADAGSNNIRILINGEAVTKMESTAP
jgi:hypothetical protein